MESGKKDRILEVAKKNIFGEGIQGDQDYGYSKSGGNFTGYDIFIF